MSDAETQAALDQAAKAVNDLDQMAQRSGWVKAADGQYRRPSMASIINGDAKARSSGGTGYYDDSYQKGSFLRAVMQARGNDASEQAIGKATLDAITSFEDAWGKATLGLTDATGGWIIPNAIVDTIVRAADYRNVYQGLMTHITGVTSTAVDIPFRSARAARATIVAWGETKENSSLAYNGYTATMYTLARIYDLSNQFVRKSAGAAEQDVLSELANAFALGEAYYVRDGVGTTEPFGFIPALTNGPSTFRTTHTAAAATVAGSVAAAIAKASAALLGRGRRPEAAVMSASGFAELLTNGADAAGFFLSGIDGLQSIPGLRPGTLVSPFGIPVLVDSELAADDLVVAEWSAFKVYLGESYRVDTSDQAGTRWDTNLTGFRGEFEMGFDARPGVYAGAAQYVTDILS